MSSIKKTIEGLFSKPKAPKIPEPKVMPEMDEELVTMSRRRAAMAARARSGRASTILSGGADDTLG